MDDNKTTIHPSYGMSLDDDHDMSYFTPAVAMIYVPKIAAVLSMIGSYCIIREVQGDRQQGKTTL